LNQFRIEVDEVKHTLETVDITPSTQTEFLGKKGLVNQVAALMRQLPQSDRKTAGQLLNALKQEAETAISKTDKSEATKSDWLDVTIPGTKPEMGHLHPVTQAIDEIQRIFEGIGFTRVRYPEVDWDYYAFEALNMPKKHPARDEWETFFIDAPLHPKLGKVVLTPHTSNGQVREMERVGEPPIRMLNIAKCYRRQEDVTHTAMFHQFEGLVIDKGISIQHLKGTLDYFAKKFYGEQAKSRIRPFMFKFTEPSFEVDFSCIHCDGKGCRFCKSGWHEVGGAGMVHPNVLRFGGIDPNIYTGFAFGWGIERVYTLKPGLQLDDIRPLYQNKLDFLQQF
jgi:phenylalanyl-tRNA synthetase alpha chain